MAEPTKSTQEANKTTGSTPGMTTGSSTGGLGASAGSGMPGATTGYSTGQPSGGGQTSQTTSGGAARQAREHSSFRYDQSGAPSTIEREAGEIIDRTKQSVSDTYHRASRGLNETWEQAMDYSRENPGKSTLIAFGVGVGVGLLMANGFATRSRMRRIVPPVMNALSEIASELFR